ncbi:hypothetical protein [Brevibacillus brevis]|uniref:hypothetical protein n=1 Tax=Brevibacillus brevis TaxID=1393 RepID=UPI0037C4F1AC
MYGHQFYRISLSKRIEYLNKELHSGKYGSLEALAAEVFLNIDDLKEDLRKDGYYFVPDMNQFVQIEVGQAG